MKKDVFIFPDDFVQDCWEIYLSFIKKIICVLHRCYVSMHDFIRPSSKNGNCMFHFGHPLWSCLFHVKRPKLSENKKWKQYLVLWLGSKSKQKHWRWLIPSWHFLHLADDKICAFNEMNIFVVSAMIKSLIRSCFTNISKIHGLLLI